MTVGDCFKGGLISESFSLLRGSSHIRSVLIGIEYRNCRRTLDVYLLIAIWIGQIQSKLIHKFVTYIPVH